MFAEKQGCLTIPEKEKEKYGQHPWKRIKLWKWIKYETQQNGWTKLPADVSKIYME